MLFNSIEFFLFFITVTVIYFLLPHRFRWVLLLAASYYFYMSWKAEYAILIMVSTCIAYTCAILTPKTKTQTQKKWLLFISVASNLGILFAFKYFNFFSESIISILSHISITIDVPAMKLLLPIGISFYTFQTLSYTIDVYRGKMKPEKHFGIFALYVSFFPQLVAGPIERATHLLPQFYLEKDIDIDKIKSGVRLIVWGLFKKVVIADRLAIYVDSVYNNVEHHSGLSFLIATYFFAFQIYCDFSAYSDIAIGAARVLGFDLMKNFNRPYFATTVADFWRRWHISLSTWLRDYLYIPLGGNRKGVNRTHVNLMITMLLGGLWHGASWTFVIWGALHGIFLISSKLTLSFRNEILKKLKVPANLVNGMRMFLTFNLVCLAWLFFRANNLNDAFYMLTHIFSGWDRLFFDQMSMGHGAIGILILLGVQFLQSRMSLEERIYRIPVYCRWAVYYLVIFGIVLLGVETGSQFIYFQF